MDNHNNTYTVGVPAICSDEKAVFVLLSHIYGEDYVNTYTSNWMNNTYFDLNKDAFVHYYVRKADIIIL